jgi:hypothetical protein
MLCEAFLQLLTPPISLEEIISFHGKNLQKNNYYIIADLFLVSLQAITSVSIKKKSKNAATLKSKFSENILL